MFMPESVKLFEKCLTIRLVRVNEPHFNRNTARGLQLAKLDDVEPISGKDLVVK